MYPPTPKPVARRGGLLAQSRPGIRARARTWGHVMGAGYPAPSAARRRPLLVASSLGVRESVDSVPGDEAVAQVDEDAADSSEILPPPDVPAKTVRVKFVLQKQCAFGEQFLVVGDDPALGQWDPANAAVLDWSEGHVWTVNTDLPANKLIEFKFLLRDDSGHVRWQHGGNRSLQTTETQNTLVVHEDWDHAKNQCVSEEGEFAFAAEDVTFSDELAGSTGAFLADVSGEEELSIAAEYATFSDELAGSTGALLADDFRTGESLESNRSAVADASLRGEMKGANEEAQQQFILEKDQKLLDEIHGKADTALQNGHPAADDNVQLADRSTSIFENDLAWAVKALQQLLRFLGFQIGTTRT